MNVLSWLWSARWLRWRQWRWPTWLFLVFAALVLVGASLLPALLRREILAALAKSTPATVRLVDVDVSLLRGQLVLKGLSLTLPGEEQAVISANRIGGTIRFLSLLRGERTIENISLADLRIVLVRESDGHLNLARLFPPAPSEPTPEADLPTLSIKQLHLSDVTVDYRDATLTSAKPVFFSLDDLTAGQIDIQANGLTAPVNVQLHGSVNLGGVSGEGHVYWSRTETQLDATISLQRLPLKVIEPYLHGTLAVRELSGEADARVHYRLQSGGEQAAVHSLDGALTFTDLAFVDPSSHQTAFQVQDGRVVIEQVDLLRRDARLGVIELRSPQAFVLQTPTGLNWASFFSPVSANSTSEAQKSETALAWRSTIQSIKVTGGEIVYRNSEWPEAQTITILPEEVELREWSGGTTESPLRFAVRLGEGQVSGEGSLQLSPLQVQVQTQFSKVALLPVQPLLVQALAIQSAEGVVNGQVQVGLTMTTDSPLVTLSGELDASGVAIDGLPAPGNLLTWADAHIAVLEGSSLAPLSLGATTQLTKLTLQRLPQGDVSLEHISSTVQLMHRVETKDTPGRQVEGSLSGSIEPLSLGIQGTFEAKSFLLVQGPENEELLSCYHARGQVTKGSRLLPFDLRLADVTLEYPYAQGFRTPNGRLQLANPSSLPADRSVSIPIVEIERSAVVPAVLPNQAAVPVSEDAPLLRLDRVALIGGQVYFEDQAISPAQTIYWQDIRVDLSDVGYPLERPASFALHAFNMDGAPIEVSGTTERKNDQVVTRVQGTIEHLTLPRFNAYLTPLLGYQVRKGAVSVKWELLMPGELLQASAAVTLHDLGLSGKQSASDLEQQVGLPMSLIVALLKDLNGNINLQLPVEGRWGEPGFRLGGTLWRAIKDVLMGAVTSPLKLLGAIFRGEDTLENFLLEPIPFSPGTNQPSLPGKEQLNRLRVFLTQRPGLDVQFSGVTGSADRTVLRDQLLLAQLEGVPPQTPPPVGENSDAGLSVTPEEEVRRFLSDQIKQREGQATTLSEQATVLLKNLRAQITVAPQILEQLSRERVRSVITALTENSGVSADRLHLSPDKPRGRGAAEVQYMIQAREDRKKK